MKFVSECDIIWQDLCNECFFICSWKAEKKKELIKFYLLPSASSEKWLLFIFYSWTGNSKLKLWNRKDFLGLFASQFACLFLSYNCFQNCLLSTKFSSVFIPLPNLERWVFLRMQIKFWEESEQVLSKKASKR